MLRFEILLQALAVIVIYFKRLILIKMLFGLGIGPNDKSLVESIL